MREHDKKTEKEFPARLKIHPYTLESDEIINRGRLVPKTESPADSLLKLAALLKKWKKQRKVFWMKILMYVFFVAYILVSGLPVYLAWTETWVFREGWSLGGKIFLTTTMSIMAVSAIVAGWGSHKKWEERHR